MKLYGTIHNNTTILIHILCLIVFLFLLLNDTDNSVISVTV